jgi:hypothetical protein
MPIRTIPPKKPAFLQETPGIFAPIQAPAKLMRNVVHPIKTQESSRETSMNAKETPTASASRLVATA